MSASAGPLLTIGHGTSTRDELADRLRAAGVQTLVDVRRFPGSRRNPEVSRDSLDVFLPLEGIDYVWQERLGGRRRVPPGDEAVDGWWRVEAFRAYAAHTRTTEFQAAMSEVVELAGSSRVAVMCSELVWWRCHRRLISDVAMLVHDLPVEHVMPDGRRQPHEPSAGARIAGEGLVYPEADAVGEH
ncbi:DUF488 domain-containing protein [Aeromicrobium duanguangcaii]|uniref:DUF488 domain-containing protein n=1 Tax=Aeromicrobium duanguangcaii TaxID=2968086 RepID=A0ABY5KBF7_9ACTN|nr:DUF488 domain-containing protein [Aeromicrobium duanguangcaii]MCD9154803.1 DUF488 domain-containing protein [Aeromicrobium duanguangcaii]UUI67782.1 DUF488 domain-containing protein [Aeromicrobium duanguangcaii]